ncbi:MAG TPA: hypothetical protein VLA79_12875 [Polyangia bacterium]|nr:hypothetical protein [Polyangia bacterium]
MRHAGISTIRLAAAMALLLGPSCYSLPKVEVIRVIDDFAEDGGLTQPTWNVFGPWTCGLHVDQSQPSEGGQDAGQDGGAAGDVDAGQAVTCSLEIGAGDNTDPPPFPGAITQALVANFDLSTPSSVEVVTRTKTASNAGGDALPSSTKVNFTGFSQLLFNALLLPGTTSLPIGTELQVELHCAATPDPLVDQDITLTPGAQTWKTISLPFTAFTAAAQRESCLATVESLSFVVVPGSAPAGSNVTGTLHLDNIRLE